MYTREEIHSRNVAFLWKQYRPKFIEQAEQGIQVDEPLGWELETLNQLHKDYHQDKLLKEEFADLCDIVLAW